MKIIILAKNIFFKISIIIFMLLILLKNIFFVNIKIEELNKTYTELQKNIQLNFNNTLKKKIKIGIYTYNLKNGGLQRLTSLILKFFYNIEIYDIYLFTLFKEEKNEYIIPNNIKRKVISNKISNLIKQIIKYNIDILIYNFFNVKEINILNNVKNFKVIFYIHQCFLYWLYLDYYSFKTLYKAYQNSKYVISIIPFENDYLFRKWGIKSILMHNYISYEYNYVIPSDLSSKIILMIGRADDKLKRFDLGIEAMVYIIKEVSDCFMKIISDIYPPLIKLVQKLKIINFIEFVGYYSKPEILFKNASLHIFPSISEAFPMVLSETKIYGIPNILVGIDYIFLSSGGTIIVYDDKPESIANEAIKILKNNKYRKNLGKEARKTVAKINNNNILKQWNRLILSIYNGNSFYQNLREETRKIPEDYYKNILTNQLKLLKRRKTFFSNISFQDLLNFSKMEKIS